MACGQDGVRFRRTAWRPPLWRAGTYHARRRTDEFHHRQPVAEHAPSADATRSNGVSLKAPTGRSVNAPNTASTVPNNTAPATRCATATAAMSKNAPSLLDGCQHKHVGSRNFVHAFVIAVYRTV